jgi:hypothetical protein
VVKNIIGLGFCPVRPREVTAEIYMYSRLTMQDRCFKVAEVAQDCSMLEFGSLDMLKVSCWVRRMLIPLQRQHRFSFLMRIFSFMKAI